MDQFYEKAGSLFVEAYDAFYSSSAPQIAGVVAFYDRVAREVGGPILELACGTGRIALPLAKAGLHVTGVDRSEAMLTIARRKLENAFSCRIIFGAGFPNDGAQNFAVTLRRDRQPVLEIPG